MTEIISSDTLMKKIIELATKNKELEPKLKREEKILEDEIYEMSNYIKTRLSLGQDIFSIKLQETTIEIKKIIFFILNKLKRRLIDNIVLRQYLISYPEFIDTLKLREKIADPKELLLKISQHLKKEEICQDKVIFYNGQLGKTFYLILEGEVSVLLPYEFRVKITDKQLFQYMNLLLKHREYELIKLILESNSIILNDNDYGDNELYIKFKNSIDKPLGVHIETEKISSQDYIQRYNFFADLEKNILNKKIEKIKEKTEIKEESKEIVENKDNKGDIKNIKNKSRKKLINNYKSRNIDNPRYNDGEEYSLQKNRKKNFFYNIETIFTVWKYFEVCKLTKGKCFGELALKKEGKKRNATIITTQNSVFGTLQKDVYQMFVKEIMDKARKINVDLLLKSKLFKGYNSEKFDANYFNCFKFMKKNKGECLFKQGEQRSFIYFIKKGEVQIELYSNCFNIDNILKNLGFLDDDTDLKELIKEEKMLQHFCKVNRKFNVLIFSGDAIGLSDHIISEANEELVFSGLCVTYCELFALDNKLFNKILDDKIIRNNYNKMVKERKERLAERLIQLKSNIIIQHYNFIRENSLDLNKSNKSNNDYEGNIINKKQKFNKLTYHNIKSNISFSNINLNNLNNNNTDSINKGIIHRKKSVINFSKTTGSLFGNNYNNNSTENNKNIIYIKTNEKNDKIKNLLITDNNLNKIKKRLCYKKQINKKTSLKDLDIQKTFSRNNKIKIKKENFFSYDNNDNIKIKVQNNDIFKKVSKSSNSLIKNNTQRTSLTSRNPELITKDYKKNVFINIRNEYDKMKILGKKQKSNSINNFDNTKYFINYGNLKLQKLLMKQSVAYNAEIDKIDKIIINNIDKVSPISYKLMINKEKTKKKIPNVINTDPDYILDKIPKEKNHLYPYLKDKEKIKDIINKNENIKNNRNKFSLPVLNKSINRNSYQISYKKEILKFFTNNNINNEK